MKTKGRFLVLAMATAIAGAAAPSWAQPNVRSGVDAWAAGNYEEAIRIWRPLADAGDADAQFNLAQAYKLGRGVPVNNNLAEQWYERAARQGHEQAGANLGLILFQNGRRREAMPYLQRAAERGDPRAQYVYGTALFNGDVVERDHARAYAMMSRAASEGLPPAIQQLREMEPHVSAEDRARGAQLAQALAQNAPAAAEPLVTGAVTEQPRGRPSAPPPRIATTEVPPSAPPRPRAELPAPPRPVPPAAEAPRAAPPRQAPGGLATQGGRWRIQLGAFSSEANARRAWSAVSGRLPGLQPHYVRAGNVFRLQAGPLGNRAAADRACAAARQACFPVAP